MHIDEMKKPDFEGPVKTLDVNGRVLQYKTCSNFGEYGRREWTEFYDGTEVKQRRKYAISGLINFGPIVSETVPKFVFRIPYDIEDPKHLKGAVRRTIEAYVEQLGRQGEIDKGEII